MATNQSDAFGTTEVLFLNPRRQCAVNGRLATPRNDQPATTAALMGRRGRDAVARRAGRRPPPTLWRDSVAGGCWQRCCCGRACRWMSSTLPLTPTPSRATSCSGLGRGGSSDGTAFLAASVHTIHPHVGCLQMARSRQHSTLLLMRCADYQVGHLRRFIVTMPTFPPAGLHRTLRRHCILLFTRWSWQWSLSCPLRPALHLWGGFFHLQGVQVGGGKDSLGSIATTFTGRCSFLGSAMKWRPYRKHHDNARPLPGAVVCVMHTPQTLMCCTNSNRITISWVTTQQNFHNVLFRRYSNEKYIIGEGKMSYTALGECGISTTALGWPCWVLTWLH